MARRLDLCILTAEQPLEAALAEAHDAAFLPGLDILALPAGLDVERINALLTDSPPAPGTPVIATGDAGVPAGALGMVQEADDGGRTVHLGTADVAWRAAAFAPAFALLYLRLQQYPRRFRHVVAVSGPSTDLRYLSVAAHAATAAVTVIGTPDQIFRMVGPRDAAGVPVSPELHRVLAGAGYDGVRVLGPHRAVLADRSLG